MSLRRTAMLAGIAVLLWLALDLILLLFAGVLLAVLLRALARLLSDHTGLSIGRSLAVVLLLIVAIAGTAGWLYAPRLAEQVDQLTNTLPRAFQDLTARLEQYEWGRWLINQIGGAAENAADGQAVQQATTFFQRFSSLVIAVIVVLFSGLYLAAEPGTYLRGVLRLVPIRRRTRVAEVMFAAGDALRWWLFGQLVAMILVGLAMGIGLAIIGVPLALLLGVLAGFFEFIPLVGPVVALGPALLLALAESPQQAAWCCSSTASSRRPRDMSSLPWCSGARSNCRPS